MDIYPQDLGRAASQHLQRQRLWSGDSEDEYETLPQDRVQVKRTASSVRYLVWCLVFAALATAILHIQFWGAFLFCAAVAVLCRMTARPPSSRPSPQEWREQEPMRSGPQSRLTVQEISALQAECADQLLGKYWELVQMALTLPTVEEGRGETERSVREALRALGSAIEHLPAPAMDGGPDDAQDLQRTATRMAGDAQSESDPVIAASLSRRAEALRRQAETVARVRVILRRNQALRDELGDQIGALRTSLTAATLGQEQTGPELADLAAYIQQVAREADAITAARVEVDTMLHHSQANASVPVEKARWQGVT